MLFYAAALQTLNYDWDTLQDLCGGCRATGIPTAILNRMAELGRPKSCAVVS